MRSESGVVFETGRGVVSNLRRRVDGSRGRRGLCTCIIFLAAAGARRREVVAVGREGRMTEFVGDLVRHFDKCLYLHGKTFALDPSDDGVD